MAAAGPASQWAPRHLKIGPNYQRKPRTDRQAAILVLVYAAVLLL